MNAMFVFVSPHEVRFMKQFFQDTSNWAFRGPRGTEPLKWYVSGGDCNPIKYGQYKD